MKKGSLAILAGVIGTMTLRALTINLTEGQALINYWWGWALCFGLLIFGVVSIEKEDK